MYSFPVAEMLSGLHFRYANLFYHLSLYRNVVENLHIFYICMFGQFLILDNFYVQTKVKGLNWNLTFENSQSMIGQVA